MKTWLSEWWTTLRVAPPFSRRRRELIALLRNPFPFDYIEVETPDE